MPHKLNAIMITAKGVPDLATRALVYKLHHDLGIPVVGVVDCNPGGLQVLLTYKVGSIGLALESYHWAVDIKWLGLRPSDVSTYNLQLDAASAERMTARDIASCDRLLATAFVASPAGAAYRSELEAMRESATKLELEAVYGEGLSFLADTLLPLKLARRDFL